MSTEEADLLAVVGRRRRVATVLTIAIVAAYFGFIALVAFAKPTAGTLLSGGRVSVGIVLGAAVIVLCPILTAVYVWWANRHYDPAVRALRDSKKR
ncbi:MAG TPA: DUF485 domain-containing protein [Kofleriaceae bacterium]